MECLAFCRVGLGDTLWSVRTVGAVCFDAAFGYKRTPRHERTARVLGGWEPVARV